MNGESNFFLQSARCQKIGVADLVLAVLEPIDLDPTFPGKLIQTEVDLAQADAHFFGQ